MQQQTEELPTGTVTFLFSDIEDSTLLVEELPSSTYRELIEQHHSLLREAFSAKAGVERGTEGDGFLVVFTDALSAVEAAVRGQRSIQRVEWPGSSQVRVRMGLHSGQGIQGGDDYVGSDIVRAARVAASAHGGQVLISDSTRALCHRALPADVSIRFIGEHQLKGLNSPERLYQLVIQGLPNDFPPPTTEGRGAAHIPTRMTSFVGRTKELARLQDLLRSHRLLTLLGPGGTGKTSLAAEVARQAAPDFPDGAWFVDLVPIGDPGLLESAIAASLGLREDMLRPISEVLADHLSSRRLLLVLDNFEHLLDAAESVANLVAGAPQLTTLVTSRSSLNLYGEQTFPVPPLALPDPDTSGASGEVAEGEAVSLFIERAQMVSPDFEITAANRSLIEEICARVDGLPLAIELAASRIRLFTLEELLERLEQNLPVLKADEKNRPKRQQTLSGTIQWSYDLLERSEQDLFTRLSIFSGGFTLEAAEAICRSKGESNVFDGIASLESHSLILRKPAAGRSRFDMLETIRSFGRKTLTSSGAFDEVAARHLEYYRHFAEEARSYLMTSRQADWLQRLEVEHANLRQALTTAVESSRTESGLAVASTIWRFWFERGYLREGRDWLERLLAVDSGAGSSYRANAYSALGGLTYWLSDSEATERAYEAALDIYRETGDDEAEAEALYNYAFAAAMTGDRVEAERRFGDSMAAAERVGAQSLIARNKVSAGINALMEEDLERAMTLLKEALETFRELDDRFHIIWAVGSLGYVYLELGRMGESRAAFREALEIAAEMRNLPIISASLIALSAQESSMGHHVEAAMLTGAAESLRSATGAQIPLPVMIEADLDAARQAIGEEAVSKALDEGKAMSVEEVVDYAVTVLEHQ